MNDIGHVMSILYLEYVDFIWTPSSADYRQPDINGLSKRPVEFCKFNSANSIPQRHDIASISVSISKLYIYIYIIVKVNPCHISYHICDIGDLGNDRYLCYGAILHRTWTRLWIGSCQIKMWLWYPNEEWISGKQQN